MKIERTDAINLFMALDVPTAYRWSLEKIQEKIDAHGGIKRFLYSDHFIEDEKLARLLSEILTAQLDGISITVIADICLREDTLWWPSSLQVKAKPRPVPPPPKRPDRDVASYAERKADWAQRPVKISRKGPGIMTVVLRELLHAGKIQEPVSKSTILAILALEFPERDQKGMMTNLNNLIPGRLREHYSIAVNRVKDRHGRTKYWLTPDQVPQIKKPKKKKQCL